MLYNRVRNLCRSNKISIAQLEKIIGLGHGTISKWKNVSPTLRSVKLVADYFNITLSDLLDQYPAGI